ncbi:insulinase family protein [Alcanivorax sp. 24]|uniref:insulinase family protein n=1 Tax=Alcanivorax sp. 24 TaxID=2545266 RepID=UPI00105E5052|nr:insulinase family protein [Alcanivorax sp. 24]
MTAFTVHDRRRLPRSGAQARLHHHHSGLRTLLLPTAGQQVTAVLQVGAGSHDEPETRPGLAHLLEHVLFTGSERYPEVHHFARRVQGWNGRYNASTLDDTMAFFFTVDAEGLAPCLAHLIDMLSRPLLTPESVARERRILDAEFRTRLADPRLHRQALLARLARPSHPLARFTAGNAHSLSAPLASLTGEVRAFHARWFRAGNMALILRGALPDNVDGVLTEALSPLPAGPTPSRPPLPTAFPSDIRQQDWLWRAPQSDTGCALLFPLPEEERVWPWLRHWLREPGLHGALGGLRAAGMASTITVTGQRRQRNQGECQILLDSPGRGQECAAMLEQWLSRMADYLPSQWPSTVRLAAPDPEGFPAPPDARLARLCYLARRVAGEPEADADTLLAPPALPDDHTWRTALKVLSDNGALVIDHDDGRDFTHFTPWTGTPCRPIPRQRPAVADPFRTSLPLPATTTTMPPPLKRLIRVPVETGETLRLGWHWPGDQITALERLSLHWRLLLEHVSCTGPKAGVHQSGTNLILDLPVDDSAIRTTLATLFAPLDARWEGLIKHRHRIWRRQLDAAAPAHRLLQVLRDRLDGVARENQRPLSSPTSWCCAYPQAWPETQLSTALSPITARFVPDAATHTASVAAIPTGEQAVPCAFPDHARLLYLPAPRRNALDRLCWRLLQRHLAVPFYQQLRLQQQLGYWVDCRYQEEADGHCGLLLLVQSPAHGQRVLQAALAGFLEHAGTLLAAMPLEDWQCALRSLRAEVGREHSVSGHPFEYRWKQAFYQRSGEANAEPRLLARLTAKDWRDEVLERYAMARPFTLYSTTE